MLSGKITAALVPLEMAVLRAISMAPINWLRACLRPPLPVRPLRAGTPTAARRPMIPMTARSSTRVNAATGRRGVKELREEGVKLPRSRDALTRGFLILYFGLAEEIGSCGAKAGMRGADAGKGTKEITIKISTLVIYIVNTSLQSKY